GIAGRHPRRAGRIVQAELEGRDVLASGRRQGGATYCDQQALCGNRIGDDHAQERSPVAGAVAAQSAHRPPPSRNHGKGGVKSQMSGKGGQGPLLSSPRAPGRIWTKWFKPGTGRVRSPLLPSGSASPPGGQVAAAVEHIQARRAGGSLAKCWRPVAKSANRALLHSGNNPVDLCWPARFLT